MNSLVADGESQVIPVKKRILGEGEGEIEGEGEAGFKSVRHRKGYCCSSEPKTALELTRTEKSITARASVAPSETDRMMRADAVDLPGHGTSPGTLSVALG